MGVNFSIKNVPDDLAEDIRRSAARNHRSIQGELMATLEQAFRPSRRLTMAEVAGRVRAAGIASPSTSVEMIREDRDNR